MVWGGSGDIRKYINMMQVDNYMYETEPISPNGVGASDDETNMDDASDDVDDENEGESVEGQCVDGGRVADEM